MQLLLRIAGIGHFALVVASLVIPRVLRWREETAKLNSLTREVFWTYAGYIFTTNACVGVLSAFAPHWLTDGSGLAAAVCGFVCAWWAARIVIQFVFFDRKSAPRGAMFVAAEIALVFAFFFFTGVYGLGVWFNLRGAP